LYTFRYLPTIVTKSIQVWINEGKVKVIGKEDMDTPNDIIDKIGLQDAKRIILDEPEKIVYAPDFEEEALHRLQKYPEQITNNFHHTLLRLPRKVAYLLHQKPAYISPATEAVYLRDPTALRPLQAKDDHSLIFKPKDFVKVSAKFPKVAFAQLVSQQEMFEMPAAWKQLIRQSDDGDDERSQFHLGMMITCGFEMLVSGPQNQDNPLVREMNMLLNDVDTGDDALPSDAEVDSWGKRHDDDAWMSVKYEDLERALAGKPRSAAPFVDPASWNDKDAHDNLQRIVSQFQKFLNDDDADANGAAFDFDADSDDNVEEESDGSGEDKEQAFSEADFSKAMREMMGLPPQDDSADGSTSMAQHIKSSKMVEEFDSSDEEEDENIEEVMKRVEEELNEAGVLGLGPKTRKSTSGQQSIKAQGTADSKGKGKVEEFSDSKDEDEDGVGDVDYALLKNLLESFKGQAGTAGPAGNLMGLMGLNLPRDEGEDTQRPTKKSKQ
jgi:hypothetical protein